MERTERLEIVCDLAPNADDIKRLRAGLMSYNESRAGAVDIKPIALYVRDGSGEIRGGLFGYLAWQWLSVDLLWVEESLRGRGYGASLLRQAENAHATPDALPSGSTPMNFRRVHFTNITGTPCTERSRGIPPVRVRTS